MKKIKLLFVFFVLITSIGIAQTKFYSNVKASIPTVTSNFFFISESEGWVCGQDGYIAHSIDGGITWTSQSSNVTKYLRDIFFLDKDNGFAVGDDINMTKTTDGGKTWTAYKIKGLSDTTADLMRVKFFNAATGLIIANKGTNSTAPGYCLKTTDGGINWTITLTNSTKILNAFDFISPTNGVMTGKDFTTISYTTDGGSTWTSGTAPTNVPTEVTYTRNDLFCVRMASKDVVYASGWGSTVGAQPTIYLKSTDGGKTWKYMAQIEANKSFQNSSDLYFKDENTGISIMGSGTLGTMIYKTTDGGTTFVLLPVVAGVGLNKVSAVGNTLFFLGDNGNLFKTTDLGASLTQLTINRGSLGTIQFPTANVGYTAGITNGGFLKTTDGGKTWKTKWDIFSPTPGRGYRAIGFSQLCFLNENVGYAANRSGIITKTTDGGNTWSVITEETVTSHTFNSCSFVDQNTGWFVGRWGGSSPNYYYGILKLTNGSTITYQDTSAKAGELMGVSFTDANNGVAVGKGGNIQYTTNGGTNWTKATSPVTVNLNDVKFITPLAVVAVGDTTSGSGTIILSLDGGKTWSQPSTQVPKYFLNAIAIKPLTDAYITGYMPKVIKGTLIKLSLTGGTVALTDLTDTTLFESNLTAVSASPAGDIWMVSTNGTVYSSTQANGINIQTNGLKGYTLNQNYPNPFNPSTTIEFSIPKLTNVSVKIYDILGKEVKSLVNDKFDIGTHKVAWDGRNNFGSSVATGIYYYKINANDFVSVKKMMYLK